MCENSTYNQVSLARRCRRRTDERTYEQVGKRPAVRTQRVAHPESTGSSVYTSGPPDSILTHIKPLPPWLLRLPVLVYIRQILTRALSVQTFIPYTQLRSGYSTIKFRMLNFQSVWKKKFKILLLLMLIVFSHPNPT